MMLQPLLPQLTHLGIYVHDMDRMVDFYSTVFNLVVTDAGAARRFENVRIVFLSATPSSHHQLVLIEWPKDRANGASSVNQISFRLNTLDELREMKRRLENAGAPVTPINHGNAMSVYSQDPEGSGLEVYLDLPWYVSQPYGEPLDLSLSNEELLSQTEKIVRADSSFMPRDQWGQQLNSKLRALAEESASLAHR